MDSNTYLPLFFAYPELVERPQAGEDASAEPAAVTAFNGITGGVDFSLDAEQEKAKK